MHSLVLLFFSFRLCPVRFALSRGSFPFASLRVPQSKIAPPARSKSPQRLLVYAGGFLIKSSWSFTMWFDRIWLMSQSIFNKSNQSELLLLLFLINGTSYASDNVRMHFLIKIGPSHIFTFVSSGAPVWCAPCTMGFWQTRPHPLGASLAPETSPAPACTREVSIDTIW